MTTLQEAAQAAMKYIRSTADYKAGHPVAIEAAEDLSDALAQQVEQQPVCHGCGIPAGDVHMSTCKSGKWPSRVSNGNTAAPQAHPSRDVTELVEALEKLARLGNGEHYGNSDGNMIAREALSKYKGAK